MRAKVLSHKFSTFQLIGVGEGVGGGGCENALKQEHKLPVNVRGWKTYSSASGLSTMVRILERRSQAL